jgi:hypothetical protein
MIYYLFQNIGYKKIKVKSGIGSCRICNQMAWIRIRKPGLRIGRSRSERNIYGSTTPVCTFSKYRYQK